MSSPKLLDDDWSEAASLAAEVKRHPRTVNRWMSEPDGLPYVRLGNRRIIHRQTFHEWLIGRMKRPNPRRETAQAAG
jgi:hypothetical protein